MAGWGEVIPDLILSFLYAFLLIRLLTTSDEYFKTPFFTFFIATGIYSIIAVFTYQITSQFPYNERFGTAYIYKTAHAFNTFGAIGATLGKTFIAIHRYFVMRTKDFTEKKRSRTMIMRLLCVQFAFPLMLTGPVWPASFVYRNGYLNDQIVALSSLNTLIMKAISVCSYTLYIICNGIFTALTSRELVRLRRIIGDDTETSRSTVVQQRNMFIIVTVCSASHLIKSMQQLAMGESIYEDKYPFHKNIVVQYPLVNGLATYSAPIFLVKLSANVRSRLIFSRKNRLEAGWDELIIDIVLSSLYMYLLLRLVTTSNAFFKTTLYTFFIATGY
ncbi:hypothetical protein PENTCL1PPCAC_16585, partial [Pristionchus entomophagus]